MTGRETGWGMVRGVLFDLDDTLFDHRGCSRDALEAVRLCDEQLSAVPPDELEHSHAGLLEDLHEEVMVGRMPLERARHERFRRLLARWGGNEENAPAAAAAYRDRYRDSRRAVPGAAALLEALGARLPVGIVSNNLYDEQTEKLRVCGLDRFVTTLIVSERAGVAKPDPAIFRLALRDLQCEAGECVMVGDAWTADVAGAQSAGLRAIWFNPRRLPPPPGEAPVPTLLALEPTADVVETILASG